VRAVFAEEGSTAPSGRDAAVVATTVFYLLGRSLRMIFLLYTYLSTFFGALLMSY
jgi:hypothetical protein